MRGKGLANHSSIDAGNLAQGQQLNMLRRVSNSISSNNFQHNKQRLRHLLKKPSVFLLRDRNEETTSKGFTVNERSASQSEAPSNALQPRDTVKLNSALMSLGEGQMR